MLWFQQVRQPFPAPQKPLSTEWDSEAFGKSGIDSGAAFIWIDGRIGAGAECETLKPLVRYYDHIFGVNNHISPIKSATTPSASA